MSEPPIYKACERCGGFDILCDAYAAWNPKTQAWELDELFQQEYCNSQLCNDGCVETHTIDLHEGDEYEPEIGKPFKVMVFNGWPEAWLLEQTEDPWGIGEWLVAPDYKGADGHE